LSSQPVDQLLKQLASGATPTVAGLQQVLGASLKVTQENPYWKFYQFEIAGGPFKGGEFRLSAAGDRALLSLLPRDEPGLVETDFDLRQWGAARNLDINPQIPPEGTDAYIYDVQGARLSFQFTHVSRRLRSVTLEWGARP
jgi:hypothetical protein